MKWLNDWLDRRACARGQHMWVGGSVVSEGMVTHTLWCMTCKVKRGDPPYDGGTYPDGQR